jgi:hypothetical protein
VTSTTFAIDREHGVDVVEIRVVGAPEVGVGQGAGSGEHGLRAGEDVDAGALELGANDAVFIDDSGGESDVRLGYLAVSGGVVHLRFDGDLAAMAGDVEVGAVDVEPVMNFA